MSGPRAKAAPTPTTEPPSGPMSGAAILARRKQTGPKEVIVQLVLDNKLLDDFANTEEELAAEMSEVGSQNRLAGGTTAKAKALARRVQALEAEIEANVVRFHLRALDPDQWQNVCTKHPPREGNQVEQFIGYNQDAALDAAIPECLFDPVFTPEEWAEFRLTLNPSELQALRDGVNETNGRVVDAPKSDLASRVLARRGRGSGLHAAGE